MSDERVFSASLGMRERLITYAVGYGVGVGVPLILGVSFAIGFSQPLILLFPVPFMLAFGAAYFFDPQGMPSARKRFPSSGPTAGTGYRSSR